MRECVFLGALGVALLGACKPAEERAAEASPVAAPVVAPSAPAAVAPTVGEESYVVLGTEPFWGVKLKGGQATYTTPEDQTGQTFAVAVTGQGSGRLFKGTLGGRPFVLQLREETCSDGMSDRVYRFAADLTVTGEARRGCAEPGESLPPL